MGKLIHKWAWGKRPGKHLGRSHVLGQRASWRLLLLAACGLLPLPVLSAAASNAAPAMATEPTAAKGAVPATLTAPTAAALSQRAADTARVVKGIINFTQWPNKPTTVRLCVVQPARYADALGQAPLVFGSRTIQSMDYALNDPRLATDCDAIYLEIADAPAVSKLLRLVTGKPVLTITGSEDGCDMGSLFCMTTTSGALSFAANLDGIARSNLMINPKVLLLAKSAGAAK